MTAFPFAPLPFKAVGFDLDGTLADTAGDLAAAVDHVLAEDGRTPLGEAAIRPMIGGGARLMLGRALAASGGCDEPLLDRLLPRLLGRYEAHIADRTRPYPGCADALDALAGRGATLAVVTNKGERLARLLLERLGLAGRFATIIGGDTLGPDRGKPAPDLLHLMVERCGGPAAFVGDSRFDVAAARAAGLPVIACRFGFDGAAADTLGADAVIGAFADLPDALAGLAAVPA